MCTLDTLVVMYMYEGAKKLSEIKSTMVNINAEQDTLLKLMWRWNIDKVLILNVTINVKKASKKMI